MVAVAKLIGRSGFGYFFGCIKDAARNIIQEVIYLVSSFMWKDFAVCVGIRR